MFKKKKILISLLICCVFCFSFTFTSFASTKVYVPYNKPTGTNVGYISFVRSTSSLGLNVITYFVICNDNGGDSMPVCVCEWSQSGTTVNLSFRPGSSGLIGVYYIVNNAIGYVGNSYSDISYVNDSFTTLDGVGYVEFGGNILVKSPSYFVQSDFSIVWDNSGTNSQLDSIIALLSQLSEEDNGEALLNNEKDKSQAEADNVTSSVDSSVSSNDSYATVAEGVSGLIDAMRTDATACVWEFPAISVPGLGTLSDSAVIDFNKYIDMLPDSILQLVRYLLTTALILFGVKSFYSDAMLILTGNSSGFD